MEKAKNSLAKGAPLIVRFRTVKAAETFRHGCHAYRRALQHKLDELYGKDMKATEYDDIVISLDRDAHALTYGHRDAGIVEVVNGEGEIEQDLSSFEAASRMLEGLGKSGKP